MQLTHACKEELATLVISGENQRRIFVDQLHQRRCQLVLVIAAFGFYRDRQHRFGEIDLCHRYRRVDGTQRVTSSW